jgi:hypothetical protein
MWDGDLSGASRIAGEVHSSWGFGESALVESLCILGDIPFSSEVVWRTPECPRPVAGRQFHGQSPGVTVGRAGLRRTGLYADRPLANRKAAGFPRSPCGAKCHLPVLGDRETGRRLCA